LYIYRKYFLIRIAIHEDIITASPKPPKEPSPVSTADRVQQVAQAIIIENFELAPVNTQLALFEVRKQKFNLFLTFLGDAQPTASFAWI
jgi:hypothetical protein